MKCKRGSDGRKLDHHTLQVMRQRAVKAVREGQTVTQVAAVLGVNVRTVFNWLAVFASGGQKALLAKPIPGRPRMLSAQQMMWLAGALQNKTPQQWQLPFLLWTLRLVQELIAREFQQSLSLATVSRVLKSLGYTPQRPTRRAWQQDAVLVERWQQQEYPRLRAEAKAAGASIYFQDEAGVRSDYHAGTTWAPAGQTPVVPATGSRFGVNVLSAISPRGELHFMLHEGRVTAVVFREFLERLLHDVSTPVFLVVDGHPTHKAKLVQEFVAQQQGRLKLFFLPPYSPQLNPDEQVWGNVKPRVAKQLPRDKDHLKSLLVEALQRLQRLPGLVAGFFRHPHCLYTAT